MLALTIEDKKKFTHELLVGDLFDRFLCCKVVLHHNVDYVIDGHYNLSFFDTEEQEAKKQQIYASWAELKPIVFQIIKGKRLPEGFQIVLAASTESIEKLLGKCPSTIKLHQVEGLYVNLYYKNEALTLTTGSSYTVFTMDNSLDQLFKDAVVKLIRSKNIVFRD